MRKRGAKAKTAGSKSPGKGTGGDLMHWRFPWSPQVREYKRENFSLTTYKDGSRLYMFKGGGYLILTPEGAAILRADPKSIGRYLRGEKLKFAEGNQAIINTLQVEDSIVALKEHHYRSGILSSANKSGITALQQLEHMREIRHNLEKSNSPHKAPVYYAAAELPADRRVVVSGIGRKVEAVSAMEFVEGRKVSRIVHDLRNKPGKDNMKKLNKLMTDYKWFIRSLKERGLPLTDIHEGNVLARYDDKLKRYTFTILDQ